MKKNWPEKHDTALKELHDQGWSASQIATELNKQFRTSYTRNAVRGRIDRMELSRVVRIRTPSKPRPKRQLGSVRNITRIQAKVNNHDPGLPAPTSYFAETSLNLSLIELTSSRCHWPFGEGPFTFCGHTTKDDVYCTAHRRMATRAH